MSRIQAFPSNIIIMMFMIICFNLNNIIVDSFQPILSPIHPTKAIHSNNCKFISKTLKSQSIDEEFYIDDELLRQRINKEILAESGVELEDLINPSKVFNLEKEILTLSNELTKSIDQKNIDSINKKIEDKQSKLAIEKRAVMRGWLKNLFVGQSALAAVVSLLMVYDTVPGYSPLPLSIRVLGFWMWWLFIIPSLRARKPSFEEKEALNLAFLLSPLVSVASPFITKDVVSIWWINALTVGLCYVYSFVLPKAEVVEELSENDEDQNDSSKDNVSKVFLQAFKALDYGSGQERGVRK